MIVRLGFNTTSDQGGLTLGVYRENGLVPLMLLMYPNRLACEQALRRSGMPGTVCSVEYTVREVEMDAFESLLLEHMTLAEAVRYMP